MNGRIGFEAIEGVVFDIQRFCIEDGPGIRTSVFLKGCQLRCPWCCNPESLTLQPQLSHFHSRCKLCGACARVCDRQAIHIVAHGLGIEREKCSDCGRCVRECTEGAMKIIGRTVSCREVIEECLRDRPFYLESGGGITLTGGEPSYQVSFSEAILRMAHQEGIHTAVETNGCCHWSALERLARYTDLFLFDLKILEASKSRSVTGADSVVVLENLEHIKAMGCNLVIRFPFIPDYTDDPDNIDRIFDEASKLGVDTEVQVLPFHQYGKHKYSALGYDYALGSRVALSREEVLSALATHKCHCTVKVLG